jgi:Cu2+-exporting ATPase
MGGGTDLAQASADMVLLADDLERLLAAFELARSTMRIIRQNLAWALVYNAVAVPAAICGWISPLAAGVGMAASSLAVIANALRLQAPACLRGRAARETALRPAAIATG